MYRSFYHLQRKPFQITTDPAFLWLGEKHREAMATLKYGVLEDKGFLLLTGDVGTGKTTLIHALVESLDDRVQTAMIADPGLSRFDFYRMVSSAFGIEGEIRNKSDFLENFSRFLHQAHAAGRTVLLIIDETQRLKHDLLEEIRLLSNIEKVDAKLLNIFFVGQNEVKDILMRPENRALRKRITISYTLFPLSQPETQRYIRHRLKMAGTDREIFSSDAIAEVFAYSGGAPRQINIICDLALLYGFEAGKKTITRKIVRQCREKIQLPREIGATPVAATPNRTKVAAAQGHGADAVLKWAIGVVAVMVAIVSAALFLPVRSGTTDSAATPIRIPRPPSPSSASIVELSRIADFPAGRHRTTPSAPVAAAAPEALHPADSTADMQTGAAQKKAVVTAHASQSAAAPETMPSPGADETAPAPEPLPQLIVVSPPVAKLIEKRPRAVETEKIDPATTVSGTVADTPSNGNEPDPGDIIDWLMKKQPARSNRSAGSDTP